MFVILWANFDHIGAYWLLSALAATPHETFYAILAQLANPGFNILSRHLSPVARGEYLIGTDKEARALRPRQRVQRALRRVRPITPPCNHRSVADTARRHSISALLNTFYIQFPTRTRSRTASQPYNPTPSQVLCVVALRLDAEVDGNGYHPGYLICTPRGARHRMAVLCFARKRIQ
ncbi:hypothetical protein C8R45DRAFT_1002165 [Mycena sanguinolenta]|nr:hypothetical protein C8R45DRAFT_1002165 [Mycena sanguinolenta]